MTTDLSWIPASISAVAILGLRKKRVWGPLLAIWASLGWVVYGAMTDQLGIVFSELVYVVLYTSTFMEWTRNGN